MSDITAPRSAIWRRQGDRRPHIICGRKVWFYRMSWELNYRRPRFFWLKDGWQFSCLSFVLMVGR